jgi:preprotein translocase subunit SecE
MSLVDYLRDTKGELKHVSWPTRKQAVNYTVLVFAISIVTALFLGFFDTLLTYLLETYVI